MKILYNYGTVLYKNLIQYMVKLPSARMFNDMRRNVSNIFIYLPAVEQPTHDTHLVVYMIRYMQLMHLVITMGPIFLKDFDCPKSFLLFLLQKEIAILNNHISVLSKIKYHIIKKQFNFT